MLRAIIPLLAALITACAGKPTIIDPPASAPLNDTGLTQCRAGGESKNCPQAAAPNQDAEQGRDAQAKVGTLTKIGGGAAGFDFSKIAQNGQPLKIQNQAWQADGSEDLGTRWHCVKDNYTGLLWEVKSPIDSNLHYSADTFSWFNPDTTRNGDDAGAADKGFCNQPPCDTQGFIQRVNSEKLCGKSNWRLPTPGELLSIIDQSQINPPVDTHYFPNLSFNAHWTNQTHAQRSNAAWYVYFTAGDNGVIAKTSVANVLLVSGGE